jgi:hypothetical protein
MMTRGAMHDRQVIKNGDLCSCVRAYVNIEYRWRTHVPINECTCNLTGEEEELLKERGTMVTSPRIVRSFLGFLCRM